MATNQKVGELAKCTVRLAPRHLTLALPFASSPPPPKAPPAHLFPSASPLLSPSPSLSLFLRNLSRINWFDPDVSSRRTPIGHRSHAARFVRFVAALHSLSLSLFHPPSSPHPTRNRDHPFSCSPGVPNIRESYVTEQSAWARKFSPGESPRGRKGVSRSFNESLVERDSPGSTSEIGAGRSKGLERSLDWRARAAITPSDEITLIFCCARRIFFTFNINEKVRFFNTHSLL